MTASADNPLVITKIEQQKRHKQRYNIYMNDEFAFSAHEDIVVKFRLLKGAVVHEHTLEAAIAEEEKHSAYRAALRYIGRAMRTAREVADKLREKGYEGSSIDAAIKKLIDQKLINDGEYASLLARQRLRMNKKGSLWIRRELAQKGINSTQIDAALEQFDEGYEWEQAWTLASRRWEQDKGDLQSKTRRTLGLLQRRGFKPMIVNSIMKKLLGDQYEFRE